MPDVFEQQREHLQGVILWARRIREHLSEIQIKHAGRVHFRPSSGGVAMIGLLPERPQRGRGGYKNLSDLAEHFEEHFDRYCRNANHGRPTPEKRVQSFLIAEAYGNDRLMASISAATELTPSPVKLLFATDELAVPVKTGKIVCDILALRSTRSGCFRPVVMELKSAREMKRLVAQVNMYEAVIDIHRDLFAELFSVLLGRHLLLESTCEKWIVWPGLPSGAEPREQELAEMGVRVTSYRESNERFHFQAFGSP